MIFIIHTPPDPSPTSYMVSSQNKKRQSRFAAYLVRELEFGMAACR
jgi:hypothetical protein